MMLEPAPGDFDAWVDQLAVPHRARRAYWHLLLSPGALGAVRRGLEHHDAGVRSHCCMLLDRLADADSFDLLIERLADPDPSTRCHALHALACDRCKSGVCTPAKERVLPAAVDLLLHDDDKHVRTTAAGLVAKWVHDDDAARRALITAATTDAE